MSANPLHSDPSFASARALIAAGGLGQTLACYAAIRARDPLPDPLTTLGTPLIVELLAVLGEAPDAVTAVLSTAPGGFEHWSLLLALPSAIRATLDIGAGIGPGQFDALELRVEWTGTERALLIEPSAVGVTVTTIGGASRHSAEVRPLGAALLAGALDVDVDSRVATVIAAARESVATGQRIVLPTGQ